MFISFCIVGWVSLPNKKGLQNMWRVGGIEHIQLSERCFDASIFVLTMLMAQSKDRCSW